MRFLRGAFFAAAVAVAALWLSGCLLLTLGGLGYTGYQYEKGEGPFAQQTPAPDKNKKAAASQSSVPDSEIE